MHVAQTHAHGLDPRVCGGFWENSVLPNVERTHSKAGADPYLSP